MADNIEIIFSENSLVKFCDEIINIERKYYLKNTEDYLYIGFSNDKMYIVCNIFGFKVKTCEYLRLIGSQIYKEINLTKHYEIKFRLDTIDIENYSIIQYIIEGFELSRYRFTKYKTKERHNNTKIIYELPENIIIRDKINTLMNIIESVKFTRDLVNEPSNVLTPRNYIETIKSIFQNTNVEVSIFDKKEMNLLNMSGILEVSKGSINEPYFVVLKYYGDKCNDKKLGIIGKGVTFDTGGLQLKTSTRFVNMKHDMAGSAVAIGALLAAMRNNVKVNIIVALPLCENMISDKAYKPGDIIKTMSGKTVAIKSTDAEGRITIADAITYLQNYEKITSIIDIASLTSAARIFMGEYGAIAMSNSDDFYSILFNASEKTDELILRVPIIEEAKIELKDEIADLTNSSYSESAKMITSGLFLEEFINDIPWIHIDIAGVCWSNKNNKYYTRGGTGWGTRLLYQLILNISCKY